MKQASQLLVEEIDDKYQLLASAPAQPQVARDRSNTSLTSLDDIAELNLVIDDLRRDVATLKTENSELVEYIATLTTENSKLVEENARLEDENNRLLLERSSAEDEKKQPVNTVEDLNNKLQRVQISRSESNSSVTLYSRKVETCLTLFFCALHYLWYGLIQQSSTTSHSLRLLFLSLSSSL